MKLFVGALLSLTLAGIPQSLGIRLSPPGGGGGGTILSASDIEYLGAIRMPTGVHTGFPAGANTTFAYGGMTGRQVGGETHLFVYGSNLGGAIDGISGGSSTTVFAVNNGSYFTNGEIVTIQRAAGHPIGEERTISTVVGNTITLTSPLGGTPAAGDIIFAEQYDNVYELVDPEAASCNTGSYNTDRASAPRACTYANWGNVYHGHRVSWLDDGTIQNPSGVIPWALHFNTANSMLYWTYAQQYVSGSIYQIGGSTLDSISSGVGTSTGYGPWKITTTDGDGNDLEGEAATLMVQSKPDGTMMTQGGFYQLTNYPQGPNLKSGTSCATCQSGWPTTTTPNGFGSSVLDTSSRYLYYYSMITGNSSGNYWNADGSLHGSAIRDFYTTDNSTDYITEPLYEGYGGVPRIDGDPDQNSGKNSYTEVDTQSGCYWFDGTHKSGVLCLASRLGVSGGNSADCTDGAHHWYANTGNGIMIVASTTGFIPGETITGLSSTATTTLNVAVGSTNLIVQNTGGTDFSNGETIHGGTSGTNTTLTTWHRGSYCTHGCFQSNSVTGPQGNHFYAGLAIYDPATMTANAAACTASQSCGGTDYAVPSSFINLQDHYGMHVATASEAGQLSGGNANLRMGYFDSSRNYLYMISTLGDDSTGGIYTSLIEVFHIIDAAAPEPLSWAWWVSLAPDWMHHSHAKPLSLMERPR